MEPNKHTKHIPRDYFDIAGGGISVSGRNTQALLLKC